MITFKRISFVLILFVIYFAMKKENIVITEAGKLNNITKRLQQKVVTIQHGNIENKIKQDLIKSNDELKSKPVAFDEELEYRVVTESMDKQEAQIVDKCDKQEIESYSECVDTQRNLLEATRIAMEERMEVMRIQTPEDVFFDNVSK